MENWFKMHMGKNTIRTIFKDEKDFVGTNLDNMELIIINYGN